MAEDDSRANAARAQRKPTADTGVETASGNAGSLAAEHASVLAKITDPVLRERLAGLADILEASDRSAVKNDAPPSLHRSSHAPARLPHFSDALALPNAFLRAALFPALDTKKPRPFLKNAPIFAVGELAVTFTGEQFDQGDLDVLAGIMEIGTRLDLGSEFRFSAYELLNVLGRQTGGREYGALHLALIRLNGGTVEVKRKRQLFFGSFIQGGFEDQESREYTVQINPKLGALFGFDMWSQVDREQRRALKKNTTAKALHGYYSSHAAPGAHRYETLAAIAGIENKQKADVKRKVIKAHEALVDAKCGFLTGYEAGPTTITVEKAQHTASQLRHLARKLPRRRRAPE